MGRSVIHIAALHFCEQIFEVLLSLGCDVNDRSTVSGVTPLHLACKVHFVTTIYQGCVDVKVKAIFLAGGEI